MTIRLCARPPVSSSRRSRPQGSRGFCVSSRLRPPTPASPPKDRAEEEDRTRDEDMADASADPAASLGASTIGAEQVIDKSPVVPEHPDPNQDRRTEHWSFGSRRRRRRRWRSADRGRHGSRRIRRSRGSARDDQRSATARGTSELARGSNERMKQKEKEMLTP